MFSVTVLAIIDAVRKASILAARLQRELGGAKQAKADGSPVTVADFAAQAVLCQAIHQLEPDTAIVAEERSTFLRTPEGSGVLDQIDAALRTIPAHPQTVNPAMLGLEGICRNIDYGATEEYSDRYWAIDPIDGTLGFVRGDQFAVCVACIVEGQVEFGVMGCPRVLRSGDSATEGAVFVAQRGRGAWEMPLRDTFEWDRVWKALDNPNFVPSADNLPRMLIEASPIRVSSTTEPARMRFCESVEKGHNWRECTDAVARDFGIVAPPIRIDSQAKYALVARGDCEIYFRVPTHADRREKVWDHAAGVLLVEEAGGRVTDLDGRSLEFNHGLRLSANRGMLATSGPPHDRVLTLLRDAEA